MSLRTLALKIHLYLGLVTGLVLAVVCFTGALLTFEREIGEATHPARYFAPGDGPRLSLDEVVRRVGAALPEARIQGVTVHADPTRTLELPIEGGVTAYADPRTGAVVERVARAETGWHLVMRLHRYLLGGDIGKRVVGVCVLIFLLILITGVWIWWPKSRRQLRARTRIATGLGWRRLNYDLHVSAGIFCAVFLFAMAFTGLMWSFEWFNAGMYAVAGSTAAPSPEPPPRPRPDATPATLDAVYAAAAAVPSPFHRIRLPKEPGAAFAVRVLPEDAANDYATDVLYADPYTGEVVARARAGDRAGGARLRLWFHAIHFGTIGGWPTRIVWGLAALIGASFPITGALIWINRRRRRWRRRWAAWRGRGEAT